MIIYNQQINLDRTAQISFKGLYCPSQETSRFMGGQE